MHPFMTVPVYFLTSIPTNRYDPPINVSTCHHNYLCTYPGPYLFIFILSFRLTAKIYPSTVLLFYMSIDVPVHHYTCSVYFFFFVITCTMTFQLIYWGTYTQIHPKVNLPIYLRASLSSNHKDLPVTTTTCVPAHRCTRSWPYLFIFILSFRVIVNIYPSTFLLFFMSTDVSVHHYTCSASVFIFGITCTMTFQLIYWGAYPQIHLKINLSVYPHAFVSSNHKDLPVTTTTSIPAHRCIRSWYNVFIFILSFRLTAEIYPSTFLLLYVYADAPGYQYNWTNLRLLQLCNTERYGQTVRK